MQVKKELTPYIVEAIQDRKGSRITVIDLSGIESAPAPEFIICQGKSTAQVGAIADSIREELLEKLGKKPYNYDGYRNCQWIVLDYGEVMVHVFLPDVRDFYRLEDLWNDAPSKEIPDLD